MRWLGLMILGCSAPKDTDSTGDTDSDSDSDSDTDTDSDSDTPGLTVTIDGDVTVFDANLTVDQGEGSMTVQADTSTGDSMHVAIWFPAGVGEYSCLDDDDLGLFIEFDGGSTIASRADGGDCDIAITALAPDVRATVSGVLLGFQAPDMELVDGTLFVPESSL